MLNMSMAEMTGQSFEKIEKDTDRDYFLSAEEAKKYNYEIMKLSGTEFRKKLRNGEPIPEWFAFKSVVDVLRRS